MSTRDDRDRLSEEVQFHLEQQTEKLIRAGVAPDQARRQARLRFGGVEATKESARDEVRFAWLRGLSRDLRYGARGLRRAPGFASLAILTLGLGIGASTALFSVVQGVLLRELPYPDAHRIVRMFQINTDGTGTGQPRRAGNASIANVDDWRRRTRSFAAIATIAQGGATPVGGGREPVMANWTQVSREFVEVIGVRPVVGRWFSSDEQRVGGPQAAVISRSLREKLYGDALPPGAVLRVRTDTYAVVGEMPDGFSYPGSTDIWTPSELVESSPARTAHNVQAIGRLARGVSLEAAVGELSAVSRRMREEFGSQTWMVDATAVPLLEQTTTAIKPALQLLFGAACVLFAIACANVSNLLLAREASRRQMTAVQLAIGAGRWRIVRQRLVEIFLLCAVAAAAGVLLARFAVVALVDLDPGTIPRLREVQLDWTAVTFAVVVAFVATTAIGLITALRNRDGDLRASLGEESRGASDGKRAERARELLVLTQVAMTVVLLAGTALLGRSFLAVLRIDPGYRTAGATVVDLVYPRGPEPDARQRQRALQEEFIARLRTLPGVTGVGLINSLPAGGSAFYPNGRYLEMNSIDELSTADAVTQLGAAAQERYGNAGFRVVNGDYFRVMGIPLLAGRTFADGDTAEATHVAVISQSMANTRWPGRDPIGRYIQFGNMDGDRRGFRIVGVVGDVREVSPEALPGPLFYVDYRQRPGQASRVSFVVAGGSADLGVVAQQRLRELEPNVPLLVRQLDDTFDASLSGRRFNLLLITVFGITALVLAVLGTYGLVSFLVTQRRREIGIRLALGAEPRSVLGLVIWRGARLALAGAAVGLVAAIFLARLVESLLFSVTATDASTLAGVVLLTTLAVVAASVVPAWRAAAISPTETLRA